VILRLREGHKELKITSDEARAIVQAITDGSEIVMVKGWFIAKGDIAHIEPGGFTREELDALESKSLPQGQRKVAKPETVAAIRSRLEAQGTIKPRRNHDQ
jgi:hypothetical protein